MLPVIDLQTDITVVGAGMVGAAAALSLSRAGFNITLIEANAVPQWSEQEYGLRVSAISAASERLLEDVGVWNKILNRRVSPYVAMHVWDASGSGRLDFDAADSGQASLGHIVENNLINACLVEEIRNQSNINFVTGSRLSGLTWLHDSIQIKLENGKEIQSTIVLAADGGNSQVRTLCGIKVSGHDYRQTGIVTRVRTSIAHEQTAWQRFLPTGPLAFLPLADGSCSIVWSADQELAAELLELDDEAFSRQLAEAFEYRLGDIEMLSPRAGFPLQLANADSYSTERVVLLGDAAHRVHPLAGQGVNLGFQDVIDLTSVLLEARQNERSLADPLYLRKYARKRRADASLMLAGMDGIQRLFGSNYQPVCKSRNLVMDLINQSPGLKQFFVNRALGKETAMKNIGRPYDLGSTKGKIYLSDRFHKSILIIDLEKNEFNYLKDVAEGSIGDPAGIWVTKDDVKYITDMERKQILVFNSNNIFVRAYGDPNQLDRPLDVAVYKNKIYVCDFNKHKIIVIDKNSGKTVQEIGEPGNEEGQLYKPTHVIVDHEGNIYAGADGHIY